MQQLTDIKVEVKMKLKEAIIIICMMLLLCSTNTGTGVMSGRIKHILPFKCGSSSLGKST